MSLLTSLISYWKLDEASGSATDSHGSATLSESGTGGVGSATGIISNARDFEVADFDFLYRLDDANLDTADEDFSWQAWVKLESKVAYMVVLIKQEDNLTSRNQVAYYLLYDAGVDRFVFSVGNGSTSADATANNLGSPTTGVWYHLTAWHDSVNNLIGIAVNNGTADTTSYSGGSHDTNVFYMGCQEASASAVALWDGLIDEVGFWRKVLTAAERTDLYNQGLGWAYEHFGEDTSLTADLVGYWKLDEASGSALDSHGTNPLTEHGTGGVGTATGKINGARDFEAGDSDYFSHADNTDLSTGNIDFTFACWVKFESLTAGYSILKGDGTSDEYAVLYSSGAARLRFQVYGSVTSGNSGVVSANTLGAPSTGTWYFVVVWHDSVQNTINIQVNDGTADSAAHALGVYDGTADFNVGAHPNFLGFWDGLIDEMGFWKRVLTRTERTALYGAGAGLAYPFGAGAEPVTVWRLTPTPNNVAAYLWEVKP